MPADGLMLIISKGFVTASALCLLIFGLGSDDAGAEL